MKRRADRSAWLNFVACGLISTATCSAALPKLSISKASAAAEAELEKRGFSKNHLIASIRLSQTLREAYYVARIEPPIFSTAIGAATEPKSEALVFKIDMSGKVSTTQELSGNA